MGLNRVAWTHANPIGPLCGILIGLLSGCELFIWVINLSWHAQRHSLWLKAECTKSLYILSPATYLGVPSYGGLRWKAPKRTGTAHWLKPPTHWVPSNTLSPAFVNYCTDYTFTKITQLLTINAKTYARNTWTNGESWQYNILGHQHPPSKLFSITIKSIEKTCFSAF